MQKFLLGLFVSSAALVASPALAQYSNNSGGYSGGSSRVSLGFRRAVTPIVDVTQLSALVEFSPGIKGGVDFGFASDFDALLFNADLRYDLLNRGASSLFLEGDAGFLKNGAAVKAFVAAALLGFQYQLTSNMNLSFAYGIQTAFGDGTDDNHVELTQSDFAGNFGIYWAF